MKHGAMVLYIMLGGLALFVWALEDILELWSDWLEDRLGAIAACINRRDKEQTP